ELIGRNQRLEADRLLTRAVSKVVERIDEFDPLDLPLPSAPDGKVVILANMDLAQCVHYRVEQKGFLLRKLGRSYRIYSENDIDEFISAIPGAAAVIFHRIMAKPKNVRAIRFARAIGIPTYYDMDDLVFDQKEYPEPFETYGAINSAFYELLQYSTALFREAIALCDYGIASTTVLAAHMEPLVQKREAFVLPNGLDQRNLAYLIDRPKRIRRDDSIVIFYGSGTKAHNTDFIEMAGPSIKYILNKYRHVRLVIAGYLALDASFDAFGEQIVCVGWLPNINSYWSLLAEADINIAVLAPGATTDAKSEIKWLEAAALGIPSVVSGTARYREVLEDGVDVIIANSPDEWTTS
ncbi:glycosyltransferase, partial [Methylosinus sp. R-45379]|uniref:glycosyltransferase n=1 Tax=Methylosinus sp. R-45379 TaxID=980563 RepID=UPI000AF8EDAC